MGNYVYKDGELMHYGVPGMKWGVRKARPESSGIRGLFRRKPKIDGEDNPSKLKPLKKRKLSELSDDEIKARLARIDLEKQYIESSRAMKALKKNKSEQPKADKPANTSKKRKISELSNEELASKIERLQLEKRYKDLAKEMNPKQSSEGKDYAMDILKTIGKNSLTNIGTQAANKLLGVTINKIFDVDSYDTQKRVVNPNKGQTDKK